MTNIKSLYNNYLNSCNTIYLFDKTTSFDKKTGKYYNILNYELSNPANYCEIYYNIIHNFFELNHISIKYDIDNLKDLSKYTKVQNNIFISKEQCTKLKTITKKDFIKHITPYTESDIIQILDEKLSDNYFDDIKNMLDAQNVEHTKELIINYSNISFAEVINNLSKLLIIYMYININDIFKYTDTNLKELVNTAYTNIYEYIKNNNNIILSLSYPKHWCSLYIQKNNDKLSIYKIDTLGSIKLSNITSINEFIFRYYLYLLYDPKNRNKNITIQDEEEFVENLFEFKVDITQTLPDIFKSTQESNNICYFYSILYATILFIYINYDNITCYNIILDKNSNDLTLIQKIEPIITTKVNKSNLFTGDSINYKIRILLDYFAYLLYITNYNYDNIIKILNNNYITYYELIDNVLNNQYKLYTNFYNKNKNKDIILTNPDIYLSKLNIIKKDIIDKINNNPIKDIIIDIKQYNNKDNIPYLQNLNDYNYINQPEYKTIQFYNIMKNNVNILIENYTKNTIDITKLINDKIIYNNSSYNKKDNNSLNSDIPFVYLYEQFCDMIIMTQPNGKKYVVNPQDKISHIISLTYNELKDFICQKLLISSTFATSNDKYISISKLLNIDEKNIRLYNNLKYEKDKHFLKFPIETINKIKNNIFTFRKQFIHQYIVFFKFLNINITDNIITLIDDFIILNFLSEYFVLSLLNVDNIHVELPDNDNSINTNTNAYYEYILNYYFSSGLKNNLTNEDKDTLILNYNIYNYFMVLQLLPYCNFIMKYNYNILNNPIINISTDKISLSEANQIKTNITTNQSIIDLYINNTIFFINKQINRQDNINILDKIDFTDNISNSIIDVFNTNYTEFLAELIDYTDDDYKQNIKIFKLTPSISIESFYNYFINMIDITTIIDLLSNTITEYNITFNNKIYTLTLNINTVKKTEMYNLIHYIFFELIGVDYIKQYTNNKSNDNSNTNSLFMLKIIKNLIFDICYNYINKKYINTSSSDIYTKDKTDLDKQVEQKLLTKYYETFSPDNQPENKSINDFIHDCLLDLTNLSNIFNNTKLKSSIDLIYTNKLDKQIYYNTLSIIHFINLCLYYETLNKIQEIQNIPKNYTPLFAFIYENERINKNDDILYPLLTKIDFLSYRVMFFNENVEYISNYEQTQNLYNSLYAYIPHEFDMLTKIYNTFINKINLDKLLINFQLNPLQFKNPNFDNFGKIKSFCYCLFNYYHDDTFFNDYVYHSNYNHLAVYFMYSLFNNVIGHEIENNLIDIFNKNNDGTNLTQQEFTRDSYYYQQIMLLIKNKTPYNIFDNLKTKCPANYELYKKSFNDYLLNIDFSNENNTKLQFLLTCMYTLGLLNDDIILTDETKIHLMIKFRINHIIIALLQYTFTDDLNKLFKEYFKTTALDNIKNNVKLNEYIISYINNNVSDTDITSILNKENELNYDDKKYELLINMFSKPLFFTDENMYNDINIYHKLLNNYDIILTKDNPKNYLTDNQLKTLSEFQPIEISNYNKINNNDKVLYTYYKNAKEISYDINKNGKYPILTLDKEYNYIVLDNNEDSKIQYLINNISYNIIFKNTLNESNNLVNVFKSIDNDDYILEFNNILLNSNHCYFKFTANKISNVYISNDKYDIINNKLYNNIIDNNSTTLCLIKNNIKYLLYLYIDKINDTQIIYHNYGYITNWNNDTKQNKLYDLCQNDKLNNKLKTYYCNHYNLQGISIKQIELIQLNYNYLSFIYDDIYNYNDFSKYIEKLQIRTNGILNKGYYTLKFNNINVLNNYQFNIDDTYNFKDKQLINKVKIDNHSNSIIFNNKNKLYEFNMIVNSIYLIFINLINNAVYEKQLTELINKDGNEITDEIDKDINLNLNKYLYNYQCMGKTTENIDTLFDESKKYIYNILIKYLNDDITDKNKQDIKYLNYNLYNELTKNNDIINHYINIFYIFLQYLRINDISNVNILKDFNKENIDKLDYNNYINLKQFYKCVKLLHDLKYNLSILIQNNELFNNIDKLYIKLYEYDNKINIEITNELKEDIKILFDCVDIIKKNILIGENINNQNELITKDDINVKDIVNLLNNKYSELILNYKSNVSLLYYNFIKQNIIEYYNLLFIHSLINDVLIKYNNELTDNCEKIYLLSKDVFNMCERYEQFYSNILIYNKYIVDSMDDANNNLNICKYIENINQFKPENIITYKNILIGNLSLNKICNENFEDINKEKFKDIEIKQNDKLKDISEFKLETELIGKVEKIGEKRMILRKKLMMILGKIL